MKESHATYLPGWEIDVYPASYDLRMEIDKQNLYIGEYDDKIAASMILNHTSNESYNDFEWPIKASPEEILVIHALGVHPDFQGKGYAKEMVQASISIARQMQQQVIRLDVLAGNLPAEKLYTQAGFNRLGTLPMFYEDTGWTDYVLFEYIL